MCSGKKCGKKRLIRQDCARSDVKNGRLRNYSKEVGKGKMRRRRVRFTGWSQRPETKNLKKHILILILKIYERY